MAANNDIEKLAIENDNDGWRNVNDEKRGDVADGLFLYQIMSVEWR